MYVTELLFVVGINGFENGLYKYIFKINRDRKFRFFMGLLKAEVKVYKQLAMPLLCSCCAVVV